MSTMNAERGKGAGRKHKIVEALRIPGVKRGIEAERERIAIKKRAEIPEQTGDVWLISRNERDYLNLPHLTPGGTKLVGAWLPRYDPKTGAVYTNRWEIVGTETDPKGKTRIAADPDLFAVIKKPRQVKEVDLMSLYKSWTVLKLVPQKVVDGIEAAMRQQDEIRHDYKSGVGVEQARVETALLAIHDLTETFIREDINEPRLNELAVQTEEILRKEGLLDARDSVWKRAVGFTKRALRRDKLGRINEGVARFLFRAAYWNAVTREIATRLTKEKSEKVFSLLFLVRGEIRNSLSSAVRALRVLEGDNIFSSTVVSDLEITQFRQSLKAVIRVVRGARVSPYLAYAAWVEGILTTPRYRKKWENNRLALVLAGRKTIIEDTKRLSVEELVMKRKVGDAALRMRHARGILENVLNDPDHQVYTVFE